MALLKHTSGDVGLRLFDSGHWGEGYYLVPLALVMFVHATYIVIAAFQQLGVAPLSRRRALRAAITIILIVWYADYINSPNWWQIWTHLFLYGFLLIDFFDPRSSLLAKHVASDWLVTIGSTHYRRERHMLLRFSC